MKKDNSYGDKKKKTYMILSTAAIIIGLLMTGWQTMANSRSSVELAYSDITTVIRMMQEPVTAFTDAAAEDGGASGDRISAVNEAYEDLAAAASVRERSDAEKVLSKALDALLSEADESGLARSAYKEARDKVTDSLSKWTEAAEKYNEKAKAYNKAVTGFPTRIMAMIMQYETVDLIEV